MPTINENNTQFASEHASALRPYLQYALWTALAVSIYWFENQIPKPLPFMRLGLANVIPLLLLINGRYLASFIVAVTKSVLGGAISGTLLSPTTAMSLSGTLVSWGLIALCTVVRIPFGIPGLSILGAVGHNLTQLTVVRWLVIPEASVWKLAPLLILLGIGTGLLTGFFAVSLRNVPIFSRQTVT